MRVATATASLPPQSFATGSAVVNMLRQVGLAIGVAVLIAVLGDSRNPTRPLRAFRHGWEVEPPKGTMFVWARIPEPYAAAGSHDFALRLACEALVAVSPGAGFGDGGEGHVRFALVENEQRIRQAVRGIRKALPELAGVAH